MDTQPPTREHVTGPEREWAPAITVEPRALVLSWGSIFAGATVAAVLSIVLGLIGFGVATIVAGTPAADQARVFGIGATIWMFLVSIVSLSVGGWMAGRLSDSRRRFEGVLHGLVSWSLVTLATLWLFAGGLSMVPGGPFAIIVAAAIAVGGLAAAMGGALAARRRRRELHTTSAAVH